MRSLIFGVLILITTASYGLAKPVYGGGSEGDEISMVVLDEVFEKAGKEWRTTSDAIWNEYSAGKLTVKATEANGSHFKVESELHGELTVQVSGTNNSTKPSDEKTASQLREALLLDTDERTDNEGGTEEE